MSVIFEQSYAGTINKVSVLDEPGPGNGCHHYLVEIKSEGNLASVNIDFQKGPVKEVGINGLQNEHLIAMCIHRLQGFQSGPYACTENKMALVRLQEALEWMEARTKDRAARGVEGVSAK